MADRRGERTAAEIDRQIEERGYCTVPDVLIGIGMLSQARFEEWKHGALFCLEDGCSADLVRLQAVLKAVKAYAEEIGLKPSVNRYSSGGRQLRFTKSGNTVMERLYSTHYLDPSRVQELRRRR